MSASSNLCLAMALVYGFFGATLAIAPSLFWGPDSPFAYWTVMDDSGEWFGHCCGIWMFFVTTSPWYAGIDKTKLAKVYLPINVIILGFFIQTAFFLDTTGPGRNALLPGVNLWWTQVPIAVVLLLLNLQAVGESPKSKAK